MLRIAYYADLDASLRRVAQPAIPRAFAEISHFQSGHCRLVPPTFIGVLAVSCGRARRGGWPAGDCVPPGYHDGSGGNIPGVRLFPKVGQAGSACLCCEPVALLVHNESGCTFGHSTEAFRSRTCGRNPRPRYYHICKQSPWGEVHSAAHQ